ncbi:MAG: hypothetical protein ACYCXA_11435 [Actinomycetes bacterium]
MRFERTEPFKADYQRLSEDEREKFRTAARAFSSAGDRFVETKDPSSWPASLRVKAVANAPGIFEITWSFSGPDGRATWEWTTVVDADGRLWPTVRWRRLGSHRIFREP